MEKYLKLWKECGNKQDILDLSAMNDKDVVNAFKEPLTFGTAGARATMNPGSNAFNIYTVRELALAYLHHLKQQYDAKTLKTRGIVIFRDNRHNSADYALESAKIMTSAGVKVYLSKDNDLKTTPFLSYSILKTSAIGGMNYTPSHNPLGYNGCKIYNEFGYQLLPVHTAMISDAMDFNKELFLIKPKMDSSLLCRISQDIVDGYAKDVKDIQFNRNLKKTINILFSPQHGTSCTLIPEIFHEEGYNLVSYEPFDAPDPDFKNITHINPEDPRSFREMIEHAKDTNFDQVYMVDPDTDRFCAAFLKKDGEYYILNGNELATLFTDYIIEMKKAHGMKADLTNGVFVTTHVSSPLPAVISRKNGVKDVTVSTGFKWIADTFFHEIKKGKKYIFGFEEAIGFLPTDLVMDKDGVQSIVMFADMANYYKSKDWTIEDALNNIYKKYGQYYYKSFNFVLKDVSFKNSIIEKLEKNSYKTFGKTAVFNKLVIKSKEEPNPTIKFYFKKNNLDSFFAVRASGTEPKLKIYICLQSDTKEAADEIINNIQTYFNDLISKK